MTDRGVSLGGQPSEEEKPVGVDERAGVVSGAACRHGLSHECFLASSSPNLFGVPPALILFGLMVGLPNRHGDLVAPARTHIHTA